MITIVDYGLGNIQALVNVYERLNISVAVASTPNELRKAERIILPGVGAFDWAITRLTESGLRDVLNRLVREDEKLVLGICVGMQMMADKSEEGLLKGLGWVEGEVKKFDTISSKGLIQLPHMGWNDVQPKKSEGLFQNLGEGARFYFLHSYYFLPKNPNEVLALTDYNGSFASGLRSGNVYGVQFHPEKSHKWGVQLLRNFAVL